jgi:FMN phosphatase YigB (HAD superfamily)
LIVIVVGDTAVNGIPKARMLGWGGCWFGCAP